MDSEKRKKAVLFIGSLLVAFMFLTSYLAFGNNSTQQGSTASTTIFDGRTTFVSGVVNATVLNYSNHFVIGVAGANATKLSQLNLSLSAMESNGSVESYFAFNKSLSIYSGTSSIFELYNSISSLLGFKPSINATAIIALPKDMYLSYGAYQYSVVSGNLSYYLPVKNLIDVGGTLPVKVNALVYPKNSSSLGYTYMIYGQPTVTPA
ncbi:MAG: hypothetical protein ACP5NE_00230 [Candidatus Micrarchaeia archaeon]